MSVCKLVLLQFVAPVHFGELGIGIEETSERVRSDTLFSAWITVYARMFCSQAVADLLQCFLAQPEPENLPFRLSSTFLYRQVGDNTIYYLPKPLRFPKNYPAGKDDLQFSKTYKKLKYLPLQIWQRWYQGEGFTESDRTELIAKTANKSINNGSLSQAGTFNYGLGFQTTQVPKIAVDRVTRSTNLYHTGFVQFERKQNGSDIQSLSGLYFLLQFPEADKALENKLRAALNLLASEGLGGERSSGAGQFEFEWLELPKLWQQVVDFKGATHHSLMSLFWDSSIPKELADASFYEIQERGGWIGSPFSGVQMRRKATQMFTEGSVFPIAPRGKLADVTPPGFTAHKIYRNGISFSLPINVPA
jgi:CRISPR-associated protein Csm4